MAGASTADRWESLRAEVLRDGDLVYRIGRLSEQGQRLWIERCRARLQAGEPLDGLGWRALVDVRLARQGTPDGIPPQAASE